MYPRPKNWQKRLKTSANKSKDEEKKSSKHIIKTLGVAPSQ